MKKHNRVHMFFLIMGLWLLTPCGFLRAAEQTAAIFFTADTEGHIHACQSCPGHSGLGGLDRRATLIQSLRKDHAGSILIDSGGAFFGEESAKSGGAVIASAYSAMGYDLVNLGADDFRQGKAHTIDLLRKYKLKAISANLLDADTGQPLAEPYVVLPVGDRKVAFIGLAAAPAGLSVLPGLQKQLAGIRFRPENDALSEWLPKARAQADAVVIVFSGSPLRLNALQKSAGDGVLAILAAGIGDDAPATASKPVIAGAQPHGRSLGVVTLSGSEVKVKQEIVFPEIAPDKAMATLLDTFAPQPPTIPVIAAAGQQPVTPTSGPASLVESTPTTLPAVAETTGSKPPAVVSPPTVPDKVMAGTNPPDKESAPRVAAHQALAARGLAGVNLTSDQVNAAIDHGRDFLWQYLVAEQKKHSSPTIIHSGEDLLAALALVHAGAAEKIPEFAPELRKYLDRSDPRKTQFPVYEAGIYCMLIEAFGDPTYLPKLRDTAPYLVEIQCASGAWNYGRNLTGEVAFGPPENKTGQSLQIFGGVPLDGGRPAAETLTRITPFVKDTEGDNSTSQFALLGVRSAARWNIIAEPEVWKRNLSVMRLRQCKDGGWDYLKNGDLGYGSMTCAGICALVIDRYQLGEKKPADDEQVEKGIGWLDQHFSVTKNPGSGGYTYYYLYSLERVGRILDTEFIGSHEWYPLGARFLVDAQKRDGKWLESDVEPDPRASTSFALLFLTRATATLDNELARNGSGQLRTALTTAPPTRLYVILDASGSMLDEMDGRLKFDIARDAASAMLSLLPPGSEAALRVYGHRLRSLEPGSDEDTELKIPMGAYDADKFSTVLKALRSRGKTPLALSLTDAVKDIGNPPRDPVTLVLLTDGGEDTMPRRDPVKVAATLAKVPGITFHIIGFDINQPDWNAQLIAMAEASGGKYWPAPKSKDLNRAIRAALLGEPDYFRIVDSTGKEVFRGQFGQTTRLVEGKYDLVTPYVGREFHQSFWINTKGTTVVTFDAAAATHDPTARDIANEANPPVATTQPASPPKVAVRFCTHCGKPLAPGAKFCTNCGAKVAIDMR
jgi:Mg-chelatase subunit ChlD